jgi:hypothetical protein
MEAVGKVLRGLAIAWGIFATLQVVASVLGYPDAQTLPISAIKLALAYGTFCAGTWLKNGGERIAEDDARKAALQAAEADSGQDMMELFGMCPNCKKSVMLDAEACGHCGAFFGEGSTWKPRPLKVVPPTGIEPVSAP